MSTPPTPRTRPAARQRQKPRKSAGLASIPTLELLKREPGRLRRLFRSKLEARTQRIRATLEKLKAIRAKNRRMRRANAKMEMKIRTNYEIIVQREKFARSHEEIISAFSILNVESPENALKNIDPALRPGLLLNLLRWRVRLAETSWYNRYKESDPTELRKEVAAKEEKLRQMKAELAKLKEANDGPSSDSPPLDCPPAEEDSEEEEPLPEPAENPTPRQMYHDWSDSEESVMSAGDSDYDPLSDLWD